MSSDWSTGTINSYDPVTHTGVIVDLQGNYYPFQMDAKEAEDMQAGKAVVFKKESWTDNIWRATHVTCLMTAT